MEQPADSPALERLVPLAEGLLLGLACGDALGVPVETLARGTFRVEDMQGYGMYSQPPGTWSDDASMALCQAASLRPGGCNLHACARHLQDWYHRGFFAAGGAAFDVGLGTARALARLPHVPSPELAGGTEERDVGSACLPRTAPLALALLGTDDPAARFGAVRDACSITHGHPLAIACCFVLEEFLRLLCLTGDRDGAYAAMQKEFARPRSFDSGFPWRAVLPALSRILRGDVRDLAEGDVFSGNYVINTLEAALWCFMATRTYRQAVLKAVNLGFDSDTTASVAGAMAGLHCGTMEIPLEWRETVARADFIRACARQAAEMALGLRAPGMLETELL